MPGMGGGGGGSTVQTTSNTVTQLPQWADEAQRRELLAGGDILYPRMNTPNYSAVGFSPDTLMGYDLIRGMAQDAFSGPNSSASSPYGGGLPTDFYRSTLPDVSPASQAGMPTLSAGDATMAQAATLDPRRAMALQNPFRERALEANLTPQRRELGRTLAKIGAQSAAGSSLGGSAGALRTAQAERDYAERSAQTAANVDSQSWQQALQAAEAERQSQQQANLANAGAANSLTQAGAGLRATTDQFNAGAENTRKNQLANMAGQMTLANASAGNDFLWKKPQFQLQQDQFGLQRDQIADALRTAKQTRQLQAIQAMLGAGQGVESRYQGILDDPTKALLTYGELLPKTYSGTSNTVGTQPNTQPSTFMQLAGLALKGASLFSDERAKTDIEDLGVDPQSGLRMHAYRYKSDPKTYPKVVGPMAQDVEKRFPGSTREIGGNLIIDGSGLKKRAA